MLLLYFGSDTCGVCRDMLPKLEKILKNYPDITAVQIEAQRLPALSASYGIFAIPAIILLIEGKETLREAGIISLTDLDQKISRYYDLFYK